MIIDTNASYTRREILVAFNELRRNYYNMSDEYKYGIKKHEKSNVLAYYLSASVLIKRICEIAGVKLKEVDEQLGHPLRPIIWSIAHSYGHSENEIKKVFNKTPKSRGLSLFYRDRLKEILLTKPFVYKIYDSVIKTLELDEEKCL